MVAIVQQESEAPAPQFLKLNLGDYTQLSTMQAAAASALHAIYMFAVDEEGDEDGAGTEALLAKLDKLRQLPEVLPEELLPNVQRDSFAWLANEYMPGGKPVSAESVVVFLEDLRDIPHQVFMQAREGVLQPRDQGTRLLWSALASTERRRRDLQRRCDWLRRMLGE